MYNATMAFWRRWCDWNASRTDVRWIQRVVSNRCVTGIGARLSWIFLNYQTWPDIFVLRKRHLLIPVPVTSSSRSGTLKKSAATSRRHQHHPQVEGIYITIQANEMGTLSPESFVTTALNAQSCLGMGTIWGRDMLALCVPPAAPI
jgi:hypothetical protein